MLASMAALIIVSGYTSINAVVKAELFPTEIRALGVGLPYGLAGSIFGGPAQHRQVHPPVPTLGQNVLGGFLRRHKLRIGTDAHTIGGIIRRQGGTI